MRRTLPLSFAIVQFGLALAAHGGDAVLSAPDGWRTFAARSEIAPEFQVRKGSGGYSLLLAGRGDESVDGRWVRTVPIAAGTSYGFHAEYQASGVTTPTRSVLARVVWQDGQGGQIGQAEYPLPSRHRTADGWTVLTGTYQAPPGSAHAVLELHLRWAARGEVSWRAAALTETDPPGPRKVRLAAVNHRPGQSASPGDNLEAFSGLVADAARQRADIVCLPEGITVVGSRRRYAEVAEPIPGPSTERLGAAAKAGRIYVAAGIYERDGSAVYNTAVLLGRDGNLVGKYRKVCLPREEIDGGITPGKEYPVFDVDFGRVGLMICWDVHFPEVARELAAAGAEVVLMPIWGGNDTLARARAIENQLFVVASGYDFKTTIYDQAGEPLAETTRDPAVIVADVDLNERRLWPWLGDWRARIWREGPARPEGGNPTGPAAR